MFPANSVYILFEAAFFHSSQKKPQISIHTFMCSLVALSFAAVCAIKIKRDIQALFPYVQS